MYIEITERELINTGHCGWDKGHRWRGGNMLTKLEIHVQLKDKGNIRHGIGYIQKLMKAVKLETHYTWEM